MFENRNSSRLLKFSSLLIVSLAIVLCSATAFGQTSTFTYQGRLTDAGSAASGPFEMQFKLFDDPTAGTQQPQPGPITIQFTGGSAVTVTAGVFTVQLDFGPSAFPGAARYLEIGVRHPGDPTFTTLSPRQQMTSSPYAIRSLTNIYGDGSDGDLSVGAANWNTSPPVNCPNGTGATPCTLQFHNLTITGALTLPSGLVIRATGTVTITGGGSITVNSTSPAVAGRPPVQGVSTTIPTPSMGGIAPSAILARQILKPGVFGGGTGSSDTGNGVDDTFPSGAGGGTLVILAAGGVTIGGSITADGTGGVFDYTNFVGRGGGGGGVVVIASRTSITNTGTINARGGVGTDGLGSDSSVRVGGGGGGGIVNLLAPVISQGSINVNGGAGGSGNGLVNAGNSGGLGGAGGASGGDGGNEGDTSNSPTAGGTGRIFATITTDPANLFVP
ncbi:MAG: hypothetical protein QOH96_2820 [Blastocatellia bacterium]|nr:hypothetical protein [Blastocatellia bacterium]